MFIKLPALKTKANFIFNTGTWSGTDTWMIKNAFLKNPPEVGAVKKSPLCRDWMKFDLPPVDQLIEREKSPDLKICLPVYGLIGEFSEGQFCRIFRDSDQQNVLVPLWQYNLLTNNGNLMMTFKTDRKSLFLYFDRQLAGMISCVRVDWDKFDRAKGMIANPETKV